MKAKKLGKFVGSYVAERGRDKIVAIFEAWLFPHLNSKELVRYLEGYKEESGSDRIKEMF